MAYRPYESGEMSAREPEGGLASPGARLAALIIDALIYIAAAVASIVIGFVLNAVVGLTGTVAMILIVSTGVFVVQMYLLGSRGQTLGKMAMDIRIVDAQTGEHPGWARILLLRTLVHGIIVSIPFAGFVYLIVDTLFVFRADRRTIHDLIAGTRVD